MNVYTDNPAFAKIFYKHLSFTKLKEVSDQNLKTIFGDIDIHIAKTSEKSLWDKVIINEKSFISQFDTLAGYAKEKDLKENILCIAGEGHGFHGSKGRPWEAMKGNLHVSLLLSPNISIDHFNTSFLTLGVISVLEAFDEVSGLAGVAQVKWINDILIKGAKVGGIITQSKLRGRVVRNVTIGIGVNVETAPKLTETRFVPKVTCVSEHAKTDLGTIFNLFAKKLEDNYNLLLTRDHLDKFMSIYKTRSAVIGKLVEIYNEDNPDKPIAKGKLLDISNDLSLVIEGVKTSVYDGRLVISG